MNTYYDGDSSSSLSPEKEIGLLKEKKPDEESIDLDTFLELMTKDKQVS